MPQDRRHTSSVRKLAAIMFTDIVGYTAMMGSDEDKAFEVLRKNQEIHTRLIQQFNGTLIKEMGDGMLISFDLASKAVRCAIEIQKACREQNIPLKIGIHEGEMVFAGADVLGDGVNIASRLQEDAEKCSISISSSVYKDVKNKSDIHARFVGEKVFKNVDEPVKVYRIIRDDEEQQPKKEESNKGNGKYLYYLLASVIIVIAALLVWNYFPEKSAVQLEKSIAVLPLEYLSEDPNKQYLADGVLGVITSHLAKISELRVIGGTSVEQYRNHSKDVRDIGKELNVTYVAGGSFQLIDDDALLIFQLINTQDGSYVWTKEYDRDWSDILNVQSEVAKTIAKEIKVVINPEVKRIIETIPTNDLTAYDFFLRARDEHTKYWLDKTNVTTLESAISNYKFALNNDSTFAQAYSGLARAYRNSYAREVYLDHVFSESENKIFQDSVLTLINNALYFDNKLEEAYYVKGLYYSNDRKYNQAINEFERAIQINPSYSLAFDALASIYFNIKKESIEGFKYKLKAIQLERGPQLPNEYKQLGTRYEILGFYENAIDIYKNMLKLTKDSLMYFQNMSGPYYCQQDWEECIKWTKRILEKDSNYYWAHSQLAYSYSVIDSMDLLNYHTERLMELSDKKPFYAGDTEISRGYVLWQQGKKKEANQILNPMIDYLHQMIDSHEGDMDFHFLRLAKILSLAGDHEGAIECLNKIDYSIFQPIWIIVDIEVNPCFRGIKSNDKYQEILSTMNSTWQEEHDIVKDWLEEAGLLL